MRKLQYLFITIILLFSINVYSYSPWDPLVRYLNTCFSNGTIETYKIQNVNGNNLTFYLSGGIGLYPNTELIIKKAGSNPISSQTIGFAKFLGLFGNQGTASIVYKFGNISKGDLLLKPFRRKVILYTNVKNKYSFKPYIDLQQALTFNNFTISEINKPDEIKFLNPKEYNILIRLEVSNGLLMGKATSLYNNEILFSQVYQIPFKVATNYPADIKITFAKSAVSSKFYSRKFAGNVKSSGDLSGYSFTTGKIANENDLSLSGKFNIIKYKIERKAVRMVASDIDGDGKPEITILNNYGVYIYKIGETSLKLFSVFSFSDEGLIALHLHTADLNKNGKAELYITLTKVVNDMDEKTNKLLSMIIEYRSNHRFKVINKDLNYYLRTVEDRNGKVHLICQKEGEYEPYEGKIFEMKWNGSHFRIAGSYPDGKNVYSIYGFAPHPDKKDYTLIIDRFGNVSGYYAPREEKVDLFDENLGVFTTVAYPIKLAFEYYKGGFDKVTSRDVYGYRRFEFRKDYNKQIFTIKTAYAKDITRRVISKVLGKGNEPDRIVGIRWIGNNILKTWQSDEFFGTVYDFSFFKENGMDMLAVLVENSDEGFYVTILK